MTNRAEWREQLLRIFDRGEILGDRNGPPETYEETVALIEPTFDRLVASGEAVAATQKGSPEREDAAACYLGISIELNMILLKALRSAPGFFQKNTEAAFLGLIGSARMQKALDDAISPSMNLVARSASRSGFLRGFISGLPVGVTLGAGAAILGALSHHWF